MKEMEKKKDKESKSFLGKQKSMTPLPDKAFPSKVALALASHYVKHLRRYKMTSSFFLQS